MRRVLTVILLLAAGCADTEENAAANLKKGDEHLAKKEYEVAEYYYERIPEESPLYVQAEKKLEAIAKVKKQWVEKEVAPADLAKIRIIDHTYQLDNVARVPSHRLSLVNNTDRVLEYITVEFSYYDRSGKKVATLETETRTPMFQNSQDVFKGIEPGFVAEEFASTTARIVNARFQ